MADSADTASAGICSGWLNSVISFAEYPWTPCDCNGGSRSVVNHLLIVEDREADRELLKARLERSDYRVTAAGDGLEALAAARRDPPDAIISDVLMPGMDCFDLCRAWMQDAALRAIPFIFYSATYARVEDEHFAIRLGAVRYLIKPLEAEAFLPELRAVLRQWATHAAPAPAAPLDDATFHALHKSALARKLEGKIAQLQAANSKLQESEARYRQLFEANPHPMWFFDPETLAFLAVNDAAVVHYGWSREEFLAMTLADIRPSETIPALLKYLATDNEKRIRIVDSSKHRKKDGTPIDVEISSHIVNFGGRRARIVSAYAITEHKQAEETLERESHRNQIFLRNASDGVHILDTDGKVLEVSDSFCQMLGYSRSELIGANASMWDAQWSPQELKQLIAEQIAKEGRSILETRHRRRNGSFLDVEITGQGLELDGKPVLFNSARDITERKLTQEKQRAAALFARRLIESSLDPLVTISPEGKITDANRMTEEITGIARTELIGTDFGDCFTEPEQGRAGYLQVLAQGYVRDYPLTVRHRDGRTTDVLYNATVYRDEAGEVQGVFAAARDITEDRKSV